MGLACEHATSGAVRAVTLIRPRTRHFNFPLQGGRGEVQAADPRAVRAPGPSVLLERPALGRWRHRPGRQPAAARPRPLGGAQRAYREDALRRVPDVMSEHRATVEWKRRRRLRLRDLQPHARGALRIRRHLARPRFAEQHSEDRAFLRRASTRRRRSSPRSRSATCSGSCTSRSKRKLVVDRYVDEAVGVLDRTWMSKVTLRPRVTFSGKAPTR